MSLDDSPLWDAMMTSLSTWVTSSFLIHEYHINMQLKTVYIWSLRALVEGQCLFNFCTQGHLLEIIIARRFF